MKKLIILFLFIASFTQAQAQDRYTVTFGDGGIEQVITEPKNNNWAIYTNAPTVLKGLYSNELSDIIAHMALLGYDNQVLDSLKKTLPIIIVEKDSIKGDVALYTKIFDLLIFNNWQVSGNTNKLRFFHPDTVQADSFSFTQLTNIYNLNGNYMNFPVFLSIAQSRMGNSANGLPDGLGMTFAQYFNARGEILKSVSTGRCIVRFRSLNGNYYKGKQIHPVLNNYNYAIIATKKELNEQLQVSDYVRVGSVSENVAGRTDYVLNIE